jgi:SAM-dependent methyltransferase
MQRVIRDFAADVVQAIELPDPIVEFGAMHVEPDQPTDLRDLFPGRSYLGTDMRQGPGVDRVEDLLSLSFADGEVGTAICLETLEHTTDPPAACRELTRVVSDGGVLIVSAPMLLGLHAYPHDYFRFMPDAFHAMLSGFDDVWVTGLGDPELPHWVIGVAAKGRTLGLSLDRLPRVAAAQRDFIDSRGRFRIGPLRVPLREVAPQLPRVLRERALDRLRRRSP